MARSTVALDHVPWYIPHHGLWLLPFSELMPSQGSLVNLVSTVVEALGRQGRYRSVPAPHGTNVRWGLQRCALKGIFKVILGVWASTGALAILCEVGTLSPGRDPWKQHSWDSMPTFPTAYKTG